MIDGMKLEQQRKLVRSENILDFQTNRLGSSAFCVTPLGSGEDLRSWSSNKLEGKLSRRWELMLLFLPVE